MTRKLTEQEWAMLAQLEELPDEQIDTVDIPEAPKERWRFACRGNKRD